MIIGKNEKQKLVLLDKATSLYTVHIQRDNDKSFAIVSFCL